MSRPDPNRAEPTRKALFSPHVSATIDGESILAEVFDYFGHDYVLMNKRTGEITRATCGRDSNEYRHLVRAARAYKAL